MNSTANIEQIKNLHTSLSDCLKKDRFSLRRHLLNLEDKLRQGRDIEEKLIETIVKIEASQEHQSYRRDNIPSVVYPKDLPIFGKREDIVAAIRENQVVVISGETGSGKTTQLPKMCLEAGRGIEGKIGCTQPRRIAATSLSRQIEKELAAPEAVSYKIRFDSSDSPRSYIKIMTDGILLAETQGDRFLEEYDTIIIDEAHERSLNIDFLLGYIKNLLPKRPDLKIVISSATIDTETFSEFFDKAPIIEVSGRMYPVEVLYMPVDKELEEEGEVSVVDMAVQAVDLIGAESGQGDILVFMATEQEIRETTDRLQKWQNHCTVLPLFGRLSSVDQNKVFKTLDHRKIIVSTNIAETSLTIPGIRYVVDSGYARLSRYCPRTRTQRLPIEPISQSSAKQRQGRCGRVEEGICIRLYNEEDFIQREVFTPPEIRRANLAEVIMRMISLRLGKIEDFPFLNPPTKSAINDGFSILNELGAIDEKRELTPLGWRIARFPIDPRTSRMLLEAKKEKSLREVLIIAAALSVPSPLERPFEKEDEADKKHLEFKDPDSDFLAFLNLWDRYQEIWKELKTQSQMRKFCRTHYLSYMRMREWRDIHSQLKEILRERSEFHFNKEPAQYGAIHRSILSGFLSHICSKKDKNIYLGRADEEYTIFPGSVLSGCSVPWVVAANFVETSRLFARTVAKIEVHWIEPLARDLCTYTYSETSWDYKKEQAVANEKVSLFGLVLVPSRRIHYGRINRRKSREIFIHALAQGEVHSRLNFLEKNQELIDSITQIEDKIRSRTLLVDEEGIRDFYRERLPDVVNVHELKKYLHQNSQKAKNLYMTREDALRLAEPDLDPYKFPEYILLGELQLELRYHFEPGSEEDGVTLAVPEKLLHQLKKEPFTWLVPGLVEEKIHGLLKSLPKRLRKQLVPAADYAREIYQNIESNHDSLSRQMEKFILERYDVEINKRDWQMDKLPNHLKMRFLVIDEEEKVLASGRNLTVIQDRFIPKSDDSDHWQEALDKWNLRNLRTWCFETLPESIHITESEEGIPHLGYPGLQVNSQQQINRTLFSNLEDALQETIPATRKLLSMSLERDFTVLQRVLKIPEDLSDFFPEKCFQKNLPEDSIICLQNALLDLDPLLIRDRVSFEKKRQTIQEKSFSIVSQYVELLEEIVDSREDILDLFETKKITNLPDFLITEIKQSLDQYFSKHFLINTPYRHLKHYPRYLKAMQMRLERACIDFPKDERKWEEIAPYLEDWESLLENPDIQAKKGLVYSLWSDFYWMVEEFKVSVFAQELKTAYPVSAKRLSKHWEKILKALD